MISELYNLEEGYSLRGLSEEDITAECQGESTESIVLRIRKRHEKEQQKGNVRSTSVAMKV